MKKLYCPECGNYLEGGDGDMHDCCCGWKQPEEPECCHEDQSEEIEQLQAKNAELTSEVESYRKAWKIDDLTKELRQQLASAEEHNARLREALTASDSLLRDLPSSGGFYGLAVMEANEQALSTQASREALDAYVSEKVKDSESDHGEPD